MDVEINCIYVETDLEVWFIPVCHGVIYYHLIGLVYSVFLLACFICSEMVGAGVGRACNAVAIVGDSCVQDLTWVHLTYL